MAKESKLDTVDDVGEYAAKVGFGPKSAGGMGE